jgi:hypothetical protein
MFRLEGSFSSLEAVLKKTIESLGLKEAVAKGAALLLWPEVVGEAVAQVTRAETVRGSTLVVTVTDSSWLQQLRYLEEPMVEKLNQALGQPVIEGLYFQLGSIVDPDQVEEPQEADETLSPEEASQLEELVSGIKDGELRATVKRLIQVARRLPRED